MIFLYFFISDHHFFFVISPLLVGNKFHYFFDIMIGNKSTLYANAFIGTHWQEEHIAAAQQLFSPAAVDDRPGIGPAGYGKGDPRRDVGFNDHGNNVHAWALRG